MAVVSWAAPMKRTSAGNMQRKKSQSFQGKFAGLYGRTRVGHKAKAFFCGSKELLFFSRSWASSDAWDPHVFGGRLLRWLENAFGLQRKTALAIEKDTGGLVSRKFGQTCMYIDPNPLGLYITAANNTYCFNTVVVWAGHPHTITHTHTHIHKILVI